MDGYEQQFVCPNCEAVFPTAGGLIEHVLIEHRVGAPQAVKKTITKEEFVQVDSQWVYAIGAFHLILAPNAHGEFRLTVHGSVEPIPPATSYPSEPEWDKALVVANRFLEAYRIASREAD